MTILDQDIRIMRSAVMDDVPEGGGAATGIEVTDGTSNNMFPDISEIDRTLGRLQLRKVFPAIRTDNTDTYLGANVIVLDPPDDPRVNAVLFSTENDFDSRAEAQSRIESYLAQGTNYAGYLFGNHIAGQMTISMLIREELPLPPIGYVFLLRKGEGGVAQTDQYLRVTAVTSIVRTFTDDQGDFKRREMTVTVSDALRYDFPGFPGAIRADAAMNYTGKTKIYNTVVADAARYYSIVPLKDEANVGDFTFRAETVFASVVPSAQVETPIADSRINQQSAGLVATGGTITTTLNLAFTTQQNLYVGGGILPGSLSLVRGSVTLTDQGGVLMNAATQVGLVDYANGILSLSADVFGSAGGAHVITYTPAHNASAVTQSVGMMVTAQTRSLSYVMSLAPVPARKTLQVSYSTGGNWYVLYEDGSGAIRGLETGTGAGTLNYLTGTVTVTLGALPDVGTAIILQWIEQVVVPPLGAAELRNAGSFYLPINANGEVSESPVPGKQLGPNGITITWNDGILARTCTDDGAGNLTGDGTGTVDYAGGVVYFTPKSMPPPGIAITAALGVAVQHSEVPPNWLNNGTNWAFSLGSGGVQPRSVRLFVDAIIPKTPYLSMTAQGTQTVAGMIFDNGDGYLYFQPIVYGREPEMKNPVLVGVITYSTGAILVARSSTVTFTGTNTGPVWQMPGVGTIQNAPSIGSTGRVDKQGDLQFATSPSLATYVTTNAATNTFEVAMANLYAKAVIAPGYVLGGVYFENGGNRYFGQLDGSILKNPDPLSGVGTNVGSMIPAVGTMMLTTWTAGGFPTLQNWRGVQGPPTEGVNSPFLSSSVMFRSAIAPLRPGSFSVQGTMQDGTTFNVSADSLGRINTPRVKGTVDYQYGVISLQFVGATDVGLGTVDLTSMDIPGVGTCNVSIVRVDTLKYNGVAYTYIPLDADLVGVDPVRLPSDGRVPVFRTGSVAVVHHTGKITQAVANGNVVDCGRTRLARVRVKGANGALISTGYTADLDAGTVTFNAVAGYSQPVTIEHRIEDTVLLSEVQITGLLTGTRQLTHDFPVPGTYVSSALLVGDRHARVSVFFDQGTWPNSWSDDLFGTQANATYNSAAFPMTVKNLGAVTERWALVFTNTTSFNILGEHVGQIGTGVITADVEPINPATGTPYFSLKWQGFGSGWAAGNVIRFNTVGAMFPVWVARVIAQGPATEQSDAFEILVRGDVDA